MIFNSAFISSHQRIVVGIVFGSSSQTITMKSRSKNMALQKMMLLLFAFLMLSLFAVAQIDTGKSPIHQNQMPPVKPNPQTNPNPDPNQQPTKINPNPNPNYPGAIQKVPMDTAKNIQKHYPPDNGYSNPNPGQHKLTDAQLKTIVGKDEKVGMDPNGNQLYKEAGGRTYWVNDEGAKVFVK